MITEIKPGQDPTQEEIDHLYHEIEFLDSEVMTCKECGNIINKWQMLWDFSLGKREWIGPYCTPKCAGALDDPEG